MRPVNKRLLAVILLVVACGGNGDKKAKKAVDELKKVADEVCACTNLPCATAAAAKLGAVVRRHAGQKGSKSDAAAIRAAGDRATACIRKLSPP